MKNWSGGLQWSPENIYYPQSEEEIRQIVQRAANERRKVRVYGSGHSFSPLCSTDEVQIVLDRYQGLVSVDREKSIVRVKAGTKLYHLNDLLHEQGLALINMGDINRQSIAGTISTGTHGTGTQFGIMSTQVVGIKLVNGSGEIVDCSPEQNPDLFKAAQVSLGVLGVITEISLQCVPSYKLELQIDKAPLEEVLEQYPALNATHRNFEFYWFPNTPYVMTKASNVTEAEIDKTGWANYFQEVILENYGFKAMCELAYRFPSKTHWVSNTSAKLTGPHRKVHHSHKVFVTPRLVRFHEMEYSVPLEAYPEVKKDLVKWIDQNNRTVNFPIENRFVKADDIYLSPAYQRDSAYIACHVYHKKDPLPYFTALEEIFRAHEGRPHWGKMHGQIRETISNLYSKFGEFCRQREQNDPDEIFLSEYMETLLNS